MLCGVIGCKGRSALIVGDCHYCHGHFCIYHRLPETHQCTSIEQCRLLYHQRNETKLMSEKVEPKVWT
jgi:hypothetical protein